MANKKNLANAELNAGITSSATSFAVKAGQGVRLPATPFFATITPLGVLSTPDNSEIVSVTTVSTDTLTVTRAQKGSTAYAFIAGAIISNGVYAEDIPVTSDDITDGTTNKQYSATDKTKLAGIATGADVTATALPIAVHAATSKTTPVDADETDIADSAASFGLKKLTWANLKATLKTYFDTLYTPNPAYSTSEVDTGKKWIDGRTIYRKCVSTTMTVAASSTNNVSTGITGATSTFAFLSITGGINLGSSTLTTAQTFMYREAAGNWISLTSTSSGTLSFTSSFAWGTTAVIATMEYVK